MTASLPEEVQAVFARLSVAELTTIDERGQPVTVPVSTSYAPGAPCIDISPERPPENPLVALLFSDSGAPMVLVQGSAHAGEVIRVQPERVYVWLGGDVASEPELYGAHMEEVRSGHSEEPERYHADPEGGAGAWDPRIAELSAGAVLSLVSPDGFPFALRVPIVPDESAGLIRFARAPAAVPFQPGLACLSAGAVQVRGDLMSAEDGWALVPHRWISALRACASRAARPRRAPEAQLSSSEITCRTALISARCVNACGKLPRWRPVDASSSSA